MGFSKGVGIVSLLLIFAPEARALDCKKARSQTSKEICAHPDLLKMEEEIEALHTRSFATAEPKKREKLKKEHQDWFKERNEECQALESCLTAKLRDRIATLKHREASSARLPADLGKGYRIATRRGVQYPQLTSLKEKVIQKGVNEKIASEATEWTCPGGKPGYEARSTVVHLDADVLSYKVRFAVDCGEQKDFRDESRNYDLNTGAEVTIKELFREGLEPQAISDVVYKGVAMKPDCKDIVVRAPIEFNDMGEDFTFYPRLTFDKAECLTEVTMSLRQLKPFLRPGVFGIKN